MFQIEDAKGGALHGKVVPRIDNAMRAVEAEESPEGGGVILQWLRRTEGWVRCAVGPQAPSEPMYFIRKIEPKPRDTSA
jgi:hypothetical protein